MQWSKFFWGDWARDAGLRASGYAAKGLWMDMLCQMDACDERGVLLVGSRPATAHDIAKLVGGERRTVERLLVELERNGVFSRDDRGAIFSRRMVRDCDISRRNIANGQLGGNPILIKNKDIGDKPVNLPVKAETETETEEKKASESIADALPPAPVTSAVVPFKAAKPSDPRPYRLPTDWQPNETERAYAVGLGLEFTRVASDFRDYWHGQTTKRIGWTGTWQTWCRRDADRKGTTRSVGKTAWVDDLAQELSDLRHGRGPRDYDFEGQVEVMQQ